MKFLAVALAALTGLTDARDVASAQRKLADRMKKGQFNKHTLMRGAKPYSSGAKRMLDQQQQGNYFQITGDYSVGFDSCFSLTVEDEDLFNDDMLYYAKEGQVIAQKSYVLFNVCYTEDCYYEEDDSKMTFITDIGTFFQAFADYLPNQVESYCEGCQQNMEYCTGEAEYNYYQQMQEQAQQQEEEGQQDQGDEEQQQEDQGEEGSVGPAPSIR